MATDLSHPVEASASNLPALYDEPTLRSYARGAYGGSLTLGERPAVMVVDFSYGFTDPESPIGVDMSDAVAATRRVLDAGRAKGALVLFTTIALARDLADAGLLPQKVPAVAALRAGTRWTRIDERLAPRANELTIVKQGASALFGTNLAALLSHRRIDTAIVCGTSTSGCVRATAVDLFQLGIPPFVPRDCVADRAPGPHEASLFDLQAKYADIITADDAIAYLDTLRTPVVGARSR